MRKGREHQQAAGHRRVTATLEEGTAFLRETKTASGPVVRSYEVPDIAQAEICSQGLQHPSQGPGSERKVIAT